MFAYGRLRSLHLPPWSSFAAPQSLPPPLSASPRLHSLRARLKSEAEDIKLVQEYVCRTPACNNRRYTSLDAMSIFDPASGEFRCEDCKAALAHDLGGGEAGSDEVRRKRREEAKVLLGLYSAQIKCVGMGPALPSPPMSLSSQSSVLAPRADPLLLPAPLPLLLPPTQAPLPQSSPLSINSSHHPTSALTSSPHLSFPQYASNRPLEEQIARCLESGGEPPDYGTLLEWVSRRAAAARDVAKAIKARNPRRGNKEGLEEGSDAI